mmetsp:Transcript_56377/g.129446  ORF Transcript_56377/g.129446 Transcript_56377/m.129446 type:complete len:206 (-) Transcript_56377:506-1123(-)
MGVAAKLHDHAHARRAAHAGRAEAARRALCPAGGARDRPRVRGRPRRARLRQRRALPRAHHAHALVRRAAIRHLHGGEHACARAPVAQQHHRAGLSVPARAATALLLLGRAYHAGRALRGRRPVWPLALSVSVPRERAHVQVPLPRRHQLRGASVAALVDAPPFRVHDPSRHLVRARAARGLAAGRVRAARLQAAQHPVRHSGDG